MPLYGPSLPGGQSGFKNHEEFRRFFHLYLYPTFDQHLDHWLDHHHHHPPRFLLIKCINGEKATYNTGVFSTKRERTFQVNFDHDDEMR